MSRDVTKSGGGGLAEVPKLSPELTRILAKRKIVTGYGGDEGVTPGGAEFRDGVWEAPEWVDIRERDEAKAALPGWEMHLRPAPMDRIREFLMFLWNSTKHPSDMRWEVVEKIYPMMLDGHPGWCFRPERLKLAAQHAFQWFPSVQELVAFMEPDRQTILDRVEALRKVSETPTTRPKNASVDVDESMRRFYAKQDRERKELARVAAEKYGDPPVPERGPGESDDDFMTRLKQHRDAVEARATPQMRRGMRSLSAAAPKPDAMKAAYDATGIKPKDVRTETPETGFQPSEGAT